MQQTPGYKDDVGVQCWLQNMVQGSSYSPTSLERGRLSVITALPSLPSLCHLIMTQEMTPPKMKATKRSSPAINECGVSFLP